MKESIERYVQRDLNFAIVDEVDSILIDEARTPLIISGSAEESADLYSKVNGIIPTLRKDIDYTVDEKAHSAMLTDSGVDRVERRLNVGNLYNPENIAWLHHVTQALRAHTLYKRDVNYLIENGEVIIVDEFTGRKMPGRRWSDGLHQAVEAKEGVEIQEENQTLATISYQNYFRIYKKLAGMTGTADTEAEEFQKIYKLDVAVIPTNKPMIRKDHHDLVYKNERGKFRAVLAEIEDCHARGQPVLVGTVSVEKSEVVASLLRKKGIPHSVLNAKQHEREAHVVAQAGRKGMVTISTNMAGRGTDIILGGNPEFMARAEVDPEAAGQPGAEVDARLARGFWIHVGAGHEFRVAAQDDVGAAAGHVGRDGHRALAAGLGDHMRLALVVLGIQHIVRDALLAQKRRHHLGFFDADGADQHGLAALVAVLDLGQHRAELAALVLVDHVVVILADHGLVGGDHRHVQLVDLGELLGLGVGGAGHAGQLLVEAEVVLVADGGQGLVFFLDLHAFLGLHRLVQTVGPATARHLAAGELVDDDDLAVLDQIIDVALVQRVGAQGLGHVVQPRDVLGVVQVAHVQLVLDPVDARVGQHGRVGFLVDGVVDVLAQARDDAIDLGIGSGALLGRARDDEWRARLVDEDGVDLVHDAEVEVALHVALDRLLHVVTEVVEAEFRVGAVGDVAAVVCWRWESCRLLGLA